MLVFFTAGTATNPLRFVAPILAGREPHPMSAALVLRFHPDLRAGLGLK
jgi:hypothetical protein